MKKEGEGASNRSTTAPQFIDVSSQAAVGDRYRQVEGAGKDAAAALIGWSRDRESRTRFPSVLLQPLGHLSV